MCATCFGLYLCHSQAYQYKNLTKEGIIRIYGALGSAFHILEPTVGIILTGITNLYGSHPILFITKQTTLIHSNTTHIYFNSNCYKKI
jgi:hypothetical protein